MIDVLFAILMVIALIKGYRRGLIVALFSMVAMIIGMAAALKLSAVAANYLGNTVTASGKWVPVLSFILVFLAVLLLVHLGGKLVEGSFELISMGWLNKLGGIFFYALLYITLFSVFLFYAEKMHWIDEAAIRKSVTYPYIQPLAPDIISLFGKMIPALKDVFGELEAFFGRVADKINH